VTVAATPHQRVQVIDSWDETSSLRAISVRMPPEYAGAHRKPGQVVKVRTAAGEGYFALASAPSAEPNADLLVKRGGRVGDAIVAEAVQGGTLDLSPPFGKGFPIEDGHDRDVLLFAAGSGIAPIRALVQHVLSDRSSFRRATLFYGQRHGSEFAYSREHLEWERGGVRVVLCPSQEDDAWPGVRGRVQTVASSLALGGAEPGRTAAFVSGMTAMVIDVRATLAEAGVPPEHVHLNF
jgi:NAD(P)H-flavin reductase